MAQRVTCKSRNRVALGEFSKDGTLDGVLVAKGFSRSEPLSDPYRAELFVKLVADVFEPHGYPLGDAWFLHRHAVKHAGHADRPLGV